MYVCIHAENSLHGAYRRWGRQKLPQALFLRLAHTLVIHQPKPNLDRSSTTILIDTTKEQYQLCVEKLKQEQI